MVKKRNGVQEAKANETVQLKRRLDLIPNLIETVKGYAKHEAEVLEQLTKERSIHPSSVNEDSSIDHLERVDRDGNDILSRIVAVAENYPDLKASENFAKLQEELSTTENKVSFARNNYNSRVFEYNSAIQSFPGNIIAKMFHFTKYDSFEATDPGLNEAPKVSFS